MGPDRSATLQQAHWPVRGHRQFPSTSWDLLSDAARRDGASGAALNQFAERYYAAVRAFVAAIVREPTLADDLTQRFFETVILSGRLLPHVDPRRGSFRPYLKQAIRNFLVDEHRRRARSLESEIPVESVGGDWDAFGDRSVDPDQEMLRAWARSLVGLAVARVESSCRENGQDQHFQLFKRRYLSDLDDTPGWREVGEPFGLDEKTARSRADTAVRHFRIVLRNLIASDIGSGRSIEDELRALIGIL
jgi:RNA polymerase sigma factor (sigma-70 family)